MSTDEYHESPGTIYFKLFSKILLDQMNSYNLFSNPCTNATVTITHAGSNLIEVTWRMQHFHLYHREKATVIPFPEKKVRTLR
ncbi:MAG: hypothetical protein RL097_610 [Candidatus Parcubacteria bacterium]|jgi:hypothetical protein